LTDWHGSAVGIHPALLVAVSNDPIASAFYPRTRREPSRSVEIEYCVDEIGTLTRVEVSRSSGDALYDAAAIARIKERQLLPATEAVLGCSLEVFSHGRSAATIQHAK
jgi:TonB family protein